MYELECVFVIIVILIVLAILVTYYWHSVNSILFNPSTKEYWEPEEKYKEGYVAGINYWYFKRNPNNPVILFCHGNNDNITYRKYVVVITNAFDCNLLLFDYRGYGKSSPGTYPSTQMALHDGQVMYELLCKSYDPESIIIWGESLGGSVATYLASRKNCGRLILFSTFSSLDDLAYDNISYTPMAYFFSNLLYYTVNTLPSKEWVKNITCPTLIIHSTEDNLIPVAQANILYDNLASDKKRFILIKGDHASPKFTEDNCTEIFQFCFPNSNPRTLSKVNIRRCMEVIAEVEQYFLVEEKPPLEGSDFP